MRRVATIVLAFLAVPAVAAAQADEIQVYDGGLAAKGTVNLTWHNNFIAKGLTSPAFPGARRADRSFNGVPNGRWASRTGSRRGCTCLSIAVTTRRDGASTASSCARSFAVPNADDRTFFYGANFEFSYNARRWDTTRFTSEVRPIVGWHLKPIDIIINPIVDTAYDGLENLEFVPAARIAYNFNQAGRWRQKSTTTSVR